MNDSPPTIEPLITSALGFGILGSCVLIFAIHLLTRKSPLVMRGNYIMILFAPCLIFTLGTNWLAISTAPVESLPYFGLLLFGSAIASIVLSNFGQTITVIGIKKKMIGDMFPITKDSSVAQLGLSKWMSANEFLIESTNEKWNVTTVRRTAMMTVVPDKPVTRSRLQDVMRKIKTFNEKHFTSKDAYLYLTYAIIIYAIAVCQILLHRFLFW